MSIAVGAKLEAGNGVWKNSPTSYTYQWERGNEWGEEYAAIGGQTSSSYTVVEADKKKTLRCAVTAKNTDGTTTSFTTPAVVADERTDFARTFKYGEGGATGNECVMAAFPAASAGSPCVILIHGGGWKQQVASEEPKGGEKTEPLAEQAEAVKKMSWVTASHYAEKLREKGWAVFVLNWRQATESAPSYVTAPLDLAMAVDFVKLNAGLFNGDGSKVCLVGASSGGSFAQVGATKLNKAKPGFIKAVASLSGDGSFIELINECLAKKKEMEEKAEDPKGLDFHFENMALLFGDTEAHLKTEGYIAAHAALKAKMESLGPATQMDANAAYAKGYISASEFPNNTPVAQGTLLKAAYEALGLGALFAFTEEAGTKHGIALWEAAQRDAVSAFLKEHV